MTTSTQSLWRYRRIYARWMFAVILSLLAVSGSGCGNSGSADNPRLSPAEVAFLSYWQCAEELANGLLQVESAEKFSQPLTGIAAVGLKDSEKLRVNKSFKEILDAVCDELESYQENFSQLPSDEINRLMDEHAPLVQRVQAATEELSRRHADEPLILGAGWGRYRDALHLRTGSSR